MHSVVPGTHCCLEPSLPWYMTGLQKEAKQLLQEEHAFLKFLVLTGNTPHQPQDARTLGCDIR